MVDLSEEQKLEAAAELFEWGEYPTRVFVLDIVMQKMTSLAKFVALSLKRTDSLLSDLRFVDVRSLCSALHLSLFGLVFVLIQPKNTHCCITIAAATGNLELVKFLVDQGLDPLQKTSKGQTALDWALSGDHKETAAYLKSLSPNAQGGAAAGTGADGFDGLAAFLAQKREKELAEAEALLSTELPGLRSDAITVNIKTLHGTTRSVKANPDDTVFSLKRRFVAENEAVVALTKQAAKEHGAVVALQPARLRFFASGKLLTNTDTLTQSGVSEGTTLMMLMSMH